LLGQKDVFGFALLFFGGGGIDLCAERGATGGHLGDHGLDTFEDGGGGAVAFFEGGDAGHLLRDALDGAVAGFSEQSKNLEGGGHFQFELAAMVFEGGKLVAAVFDGRNLRGTFLRETGGFLLACGEAFAGAREFVVELLQHVAGGHGLLLGVAALGVEAVTKAGEFFDFFR